MLRNKILWIVVILALFGSAHLVAEEKKEVLTLKNLASYFAFDQLNPKVNPCIPVEVILSNPKYGKFACLSKGEVLPFTSKTGEWFQCKLSKKSEIMVFKTVDVCRQEVAAMLAPTKSKP